MMKQKREKHSIYKRTVPVFHIDSLTVQLCARISIALIGRQFEILRCLNNVLRNTQTSLQPNIASVLPQIGWDDEVQFHS
jgi:hypothetical protein